MNFAQILQQTVMPLSDRVPLCEANQKAKAKASKGRQNNSTHVANQVLHRQTVDRYRKAMGDEWISTKRITDRLGYSRYASYDTLNSWVAQGILEKRKAGGVADWTLKKGFEWRFAK